MRDEIRADYRNSKIRHKGVRGLAKPKNDSGVRHFSCCCVIPPWMIDGCNPGFRGLRLAAGISSSVASNLEGSASIGWESEKLHYRISDKTCFLCETSSWLPAKLCVCPRISLEVAEGMTRCFAWPHDWAVFIAPASLKPCGARSVFDLICLKVPSRAVS
jgi:hypothetical protein